MFFAFAYYATASNYYPEYFVDIAAGNAKNGSKIFLRPFFGYLCSNSIENDVRDLEETLSKQDEMAPYKYYKKDQIHSWVILDYEDDKNYKFAGIIQSNFEIDKEANGEFAELAFYIHPDFRRQGFAYQSSVALMKHLLNSRTSLLGIVFDVAKKNTACRNLMDKFKNEFGFLMSSDRVVGQFMHNDDKKIIGNRFYRYFRGKQALMFDKSKAVKILQDI